MTRLKTKLTLKQNQTGEKFMSTDVI